MADQKLTIQVGEQQVLSVLTYDDVDPNWTRVWVTSSCGGQSSRNPISILHRSGYTATQAEHDIEEARWDFAQKLAARLGIRSTVSGVIQKVTGTPRVTTAKEHPAPSGPTPAPASAAPVTK